MLVVIALHFAAIPGYLSGFPIQSIQKLNASPGLALTVQVISSIVSLSCATLCLTLATILFLVRPSDRMAIYVSFYLMLYAVLMSGVIEAVAFYTDLSFSKIYLLQLIFFAVPTIILLCLFPNGRLVPGWTIWPAIGSILVVLLVLSRPAEDWLSFSTPFARMILFIILSILLCSMCAQVYRYRHVLTLTEKAQVKWVVAGLFAWFICMAASFIPWSQVQSLPPDQAYPWWFPLLNISWWLSLTIFPLVLTLSILRYKLFDIDIIIRRTLVYGALTLTLGLVYFGSVVLLQELFQAITGQGGSPIATVISTLAIAALFTPLRRRIQNDIDRRFYRRKYDASRTVDEFARRARDMVELDVLTGHLLDLVEKTLQPEHLSLWLKPDAGKISKQVHN
jgi:hypothetical protein